VLPSVHRPRSPIAQSTHDSPHSSLPTNVNKSTNPDLFTALKGGTNNFTIVTRYDMETFPSEELRGGIVTWPAFTINQHFQSLVNFGLNPNRDPNAALIVFQGYSTLSPTNVVRAAFDYTRPVARPAAYKEFFAVNNTLSDSTKIQPMSAIAAEFGSDTTKRYVAPSEPSWMTAKLFL